MGRGSSPHLAANYFSVNHFSVNHVLEARPGSQPPRHHQRAVDHHLFAQGGRDDRIGMGQRREDVTGHVMTQGLEEHLLAGQRHAAPDHHHLRGNNRNHLGNGPAQRLHPAAQNPLRHRVAGGSRLDHHPAAELLDPAATAGQQVRCRRVVDVLVREPLPPGRGNGETAGQRFYRRPRIVGIQPWPQVADLGGDAVPARVDAAVDDQAPPMPLPTVT